MDANKRQELFGDAFFSAVCAHADYYTNKPDQDTGVDWQVYREIGSPTLDVQLKTTSNEALDEESQKYKYALKVKNYQDLIEERIANKRILVVVFVPKESEQEWLECSSERLLLRRCAYWVNLRGHPATKNKQTITIDIPIAQRFDTEQLDSIMRQYEESYWEG